MDATRARDGRAASTTTPLRAGAGLSICLLGTPKFAWANGTVHLLEHHDAALLALLALEGPTSRARAATLLWPDLPEGRARANLRQRLHRLRLLDPASIEYAEGSLRLHDGVAVDVLGAHDALIADPRAAEGELLGTLSGGVAGALDEWMQAARDGWRRARIEWLAQEASRHEADHQLAAALAYAQRIVAEDPLLEHAHRRLMRLHYLRDDRAAALAACRACREILKRELDVEPADETLALMRLIDSGTAAAPSPALAIAPASRAPARPPAPPVLRTARLVGRDAEWERLVRVHREAGRALVHGEPGIGKTRLLREFARAHGAVVVDARLGDAQLPYALLARLVGTLSQHRVQPACWATQELARFVPELGPSSPQPLHPIRLEQAFAHAIETWCADGLTLIAIDDLEHADAATLEMLLRVGASSSPAAAWIFGMRSGEVAPVLKRWLNETGPNHLECIDPARLDADAVRAMLESMVVPGIDPAAWAAPLAHHASGNPLYIVETLAAVLAQRPNAPGDGLMQPPDVLPTPVPVRQLIERRLQHLDPAALQLARIAAVAGQDFSAAVAAAVRGCQPLDLVEPWSELVRAHVLVDDGFVHDLVRDATLCTMPAAVARELHAAVALALDATGDAAPARIAHHWQAAERWQQAGPAWMAAAQRAYDASRYGEAEPMFERAAQSFERCGQTSRRSVALQELIGCRLKRNDLDAARRDATTLRALTLDDEGQAWALDRLGEIANLGREDAVAASVAREMLAAAADSANGWIAFNATRKLGSALANLGRHDESLALFASQRAWIESHPQEWNVHVWLCDRATALDTADRRTEAIAAFDHAIREARRHGNWYVVYAALRNRALAHHWLGQLDAALRDMGHALELADRIGAAQTRDNPRDASRCAMLLRTAGRHREALELLERCSRAYGPGSGVFWPAYCDDQLALTWLELGQPARAAALVGRPLGADHAEALATRAIVRSRCMHDSDAGDAAAEPLQREVFERRECPPRWALLAALERSRSLDAAGARGACDAVADEAERRELHGIALHARLLAGAAALRAGATRDAEARVHATVTAWRTTGCDPTGMSCAEFAWIGARALRALGDTTLAQALIDDAAERLQRTANDHVPEPFRFSFAQRHPVHRELLAARRC